MKCEAPLRWKSKKITVLFGTPGDLGPITVEAFVSGFFAVHASVWGDSATVTHRPTGYIILLCQDIPSAKAAAQFIHDLNLDWNFDKPEQARLLAPSFSAHRDEIHAIAYPGTANATPGSHTDPPEAKK
jgi:hypothetical protein